MAEWKWSRPYLSFLFCSSNLSLEAVLVEELNYRSGEVAQVVQYLFSTHKALGSKLGMETGGEIPVL